LPEVTLVFEVGHLIHLIILDGIVEVIQPRLQLEVVLLDLAEELAVLLLLLTVHLLEMLDFLQQSLVDRFLYWQESELLSVIYVFGAFQAS